MGRRVTQRDIARMTGVSQATVSVVLKAGPTARCGSPRRPGDRVLHAIRDTGYVADLVGRAARRPQQPDPRRVHLRAGFPSATADFYHPFLVGIEQRAEQLGCDLLLFTVRPRTGCAWPTAASCWAASIGRDELARLVAEHPRSSASAGATRRRRALRRRRLRCRDRRAGRARRSGSGHRRLAYVGTGGPAESHLDRLRGFTDACLAAGVFATHEPRRNTEQPDALADAIPRLLAQGRRRAVPGGARGRGRADRGAARARGRDVPGDVSVVVLGEPTRAGATPPPSRSPGSAPRAARWAGRRSTTSPKSSAAGRCAADVAGLRARPR